jgi:hypothetical protein
MTLGNKSTGLYVCSFFTFDLIFITTCPTASKPAPAAAADDSTFGD